MTWKDSPSPSQASRPRPGSSCSTGGCGRSRCRPLRLLAAGVGLTCLLPSTGCVPSLRPLPDNLRDEPLRIAEAQGYVRLEGFTPEGTPIDLGWYDAGSLAGQTVVRYDWTP